MNPYPKTIVILALTIIATACNAPSSTPIVTTTQSPTFSSASQGATQAAPAEAPDPIQTATQPTVVPTDTAAVASDLPTEAPIPTATAAPAASGGEVGGEGGEAPLATYADPQQGFSIDYPKPWTRDVAVTTGVKFDGDGTMMLAFIQADPGAVRAYANADAKVFGGGLPSFKQLSLAVSREVKKALVLAFETTGTSNVTGKIYAARGDRYYMPLNDGRIAVLTVISPIRNYDREGVRDIALTLSLTK